MNAYSLHQKVIRPLLARELYALLAARHEQPDMFLSGTGLFPHHLQADQLIAPSQLYRLVRQSLQLGAGDLPAQLGHRLLYSADPLAQALLGADSLWQGLRLLARFQALWALPVQVRSSTVGGFCYLDFHCPLGRADLARYFLLCASSVMDEWLKCRFGAEPRWQLPLAPSDAGLFAGATPSPLWRLSLAGPPVLPAQVTSTPEQHRLRAACQRLLLSLPARQSLLAVSVKFLRPRPQATLADLALYLHTSPATLKRRLKDEGTCFQQLQDGLRGQQALELLTDRGWTNQRLADFFQINDVNNFRRAFKRWTGFTPSEIKPA